MIEQTISGTRLRGASFGRVRDLAGFARFHREPEEHSPNARRFVQVAGAEDLAARADLLFSAIRKGFRYKRKEIAMACEEGGGTIRTPDFEVILNLEQDPEEAAGYRLSTEVGEIRRQDILAAPPFVEVFAPYCDRIVVGFARPIDLDARIDHIEENDELAKFLDYDAACSWFVLRLPHLIVEVNSLEMICRLPGERNLGQLIAQTQAALTRLAGAGLLLER